MKRRDATTHRFCVRSVRHDLLERRPQVVDGIKSSAYLRHVLDIAVQLVHSRDTLAQVLFAEGRKWRSVNAVPSLRNSPVSRRTPSRTTRCLRSRLFRLLCFC